jgi:di/tricarboxylate transporter
MNWIPGAIDFVVTSLGYTPTPRRETTVVILAVAALLGIGVLGLVLVTQGRWDTLRAFFGGVSGGVIGLVIGLGADQGSVAARWGAVLGLLGVAVLAVTRAVTRPDMGGAARGLSPKE